ncbi:MAG: hypothetical protein GY757_19730, partial [bacterium]|nr:hypothetical protein [bacterium]
KATVILVNAMGIHKIPRRLLFIENGEIIVHEETDQLQETLKKVILKATGGVARVPSGGPQGGQNLFEKRVPTPPKAFI